MKLCKNVKRGTFRKLYKSNYEMWMWAINLKEGDLVNTCQSKWNRVVKEIKIYWEKQEFPETKKGWKYRPGSLLVDAICIEDTCGYSHYFPGGGCVGKPETFSKEEIESYSSSIFQLDSSGTQTLKIQ